MPWNLDPKRPIYAQIVERIQLDILTGRYRPGDRLPSVRELAAEAAVNPNTMQRALAELERGGLVYTQRTSGRFITDDTGLIRQLRQRLAALQVREFIRMMRRLNMTDDEIVRLVTALLKEENTE